MDDTVVGVDGWEGMDDTVVYLKQPAVIQVHLSCMLYYPWL